ncbi:MAG TPA: FlgD immunoglobulin-like domain containing protein, partial [Bacteroidota bacterium]|nr:FlgD immunoglobulin-like domain containing protein [Bacteroidota bacterium]
LTYLGTADSLVFRWTVLAKDTPNPPVSTTDTFAVTIRRSLPPPPAGWTNQTSGVTAVLQSTKQVNSSVAWAAGNGGVVLRTTNGGNTWSSVGGGAMGTLDLYAIDAISATTAFTTASPATGSYLFRTTNAGTSWDTVFFQSGGFLNAIHMFDATNGIAVGDPVGTWTVLRTSNGGASWARIATEPAQVGSEFGANNGLAVVGNNHIWFSPGTATGRVYRSTDGGATWASSVLPFLQFTSGLAFSNTQYGVAGGSGGAAARTTDGGVTWTSVTLPASGTVYGIAATNAEFFATRGAAIYRSTDRGATWASSYAGGVGALNHISAASAGANAYLKAVSGTGGITSGYFVVTGVDDQPEELPGSFTLMQNYPNPFNPSTTIRYALPKDAFVTLKVYNLLGQEVASLRDEMQNVGFHDVVWNGRNNAGQTIASGVYFYRLEARPADGAEPFTSFKKMLMLK